MFVLLIKGITLFIAKMLNDIIMLITQSCFSINQSQVVEHYTYLLPAVVNHLVKAKKFKSMINAKD